MQGTFKTPGMRMADVGEMERRADQGYKDQEERLGNKDLWGQRVVELAERHIVPLYQGPR